jgi:hypothetical protein
MPNLTGENLTPNPRNMTTLMGAFRTKLDKLDDLLSDLGYYGDLADELRELAECIPEDAAMIMVKSDPTG